MVREGNWYCGPFLLVAWLCIGPSHFLQGYEPFPKPKPDSASQAGLVRTAQHPSVAPPERMGPERFLAQVQRDVLHTQGQLGAFPVGHNMHGRQRRAQFVGRNRLFRAAPLESRLGLRHAVFDSSSTVGKLNLFGINKLLGAENPCHYIPVRDAIFDGSA